MQRENARGDAPCTHEVILPDSVRYLPDYVAVRRCLRCGRLALERYTDPVALKWALLWALLGLAVVVCLCVALAAESRGCA